MIKTSMSLDSSASFLFIVRHPPSSPLFPYTTLFRSEASRVAGTASRLVVYRGDAAPHRRVRAERQRGRSEEHTSELQSRQYLVCRLLLEKKKRAPAGQQTARPVRANPAAN